MRKILIFGNSGSGKSTLAKELAKSDNLAHLDLDTLAWRPTTPPSRSPLDEAKINIHGFTNSNTDWVIEGCYTDLLEVVSPVATEIIFMDLTVPQCIENARSRPWEPHKYESKAAQDKNLEMLLEWITDYEKRDDVFSHSSHVQFFEKFPGFKTRYLNNQRTT